MKLISLNTWEGQIYEPLKEFIKNHAENTDIFCFQEVLQEEQLNMFNDFKQLLPDFFSFFSEQAHGVGLAMFIKNTLKVENPDSFLILSTEELGHLKMADGSNYYPRVMQSIYLKEQNLTICNFHGVPGDLKKDNPERELQTKRLQETLNNCKGPKIITGDFNLNPDTKAVLALEQEMQNPIKNTNFKTTRSKYYKNKEIMPFADYSFVSPEIKIKNFEVLQDEISDHLPLLLEF